MGVVDQSHTDYHRMTSASTQKTESTITAISATNIITAWGAHHLTMAATRSLSDRNLSWSAVLLLLTSFLSFVDLTSTQDTQYVQATTSSGNTIYLPNNRKPALYTKNFGDCLGESLITVTRFDAAYYQDNMTVLFHLEGNTNVANESIMSMETQKWNYERSSLIRLW